MESPACHGAVLICRFAMNCCSPHEPRKRTAPRMAPEAMWGLLQQAEPGNAHSARLDFKFLSLTLGIYSCAATAARKGLGPLVT